MTAPDAVEATREAVSALQSAVERLRREYGETLGIRRISSDVERFLTDLDELGAPEPGYHPQPEPDQLEEIPDEPYDESMWADAETEGHVPRNPSAR
jgi:hypothetical protein